jgi:hypothetical protein
LRVFNVREWVFFVPFFFEGQRRIAGYLPVEFKVPQDFPQPPRNLKHA